MGNGLLLWCYHQLITSYALGKVKEDWNSWFFCHCNIFKAFKWWCYSFFAAGVRLQFFKASVSMNSVSRYIFLKSSLMQEFSWRLMKFKFFNGSKAFGSITFNWLFCSQILFICRFLSNNPAGSVSNSFPFNRISRNSPRPLNVSRGNSCNLFCDKISIWSFARPWKASLLMVWMKFELKLNHSNLLAPVKDDALSCESSFESRLAFNKFSAPLKSPLLRLRNWQFWRLKSFNCGNLLKTSLGK